MFYLYIVLCICYKNISNVNLPKTNNSYSDYTDLFFTEQLLTELLWTVYKGYLNFRLIS